MRNKIKRMIAIAVTAATLTTGINCIVADAASGVISESSVSVSRPYSYDASYSFTTYGSPQACTYNGNSTNITATYSNMKISFIQASNQAAYIVVHDNTTNSDVYTFVIPNNPISTQTIFVNTTVGHVYSFSAYTSGFSQGNFYVEY